jgi:Zn-dependent protease with chaperone function
MARAPGRASASRLRLAALVLEGYAYLFGTILVFASTVAFLAWGLLTLNPLIGLMAVLTGLPVTMLTASAMRALFFRLPMPSGPEIARRQASAVIEIVEEVRRSLGAPRVHRILAGMEFNASAAQYPRLGLFWPRNILVIGYPLLIALSPAQLKAVIAHELAHLRHAHGTVAAWIYRTRRSWIGLSATLHQRGAVPIFVRLMLAHYVPRLERGSLALARAQEERADRDAAAVAGARVAAETLVAMELGQSWSEQVFWPSVHDRVATESAPPRPFALMPQAFADTAAQHATPELLAFVLQRVTDAYDTHPSLRDRLRAIGEEARLPEWDAASLRPACDGALLALIAERLDRCWRERHGAAWAERHARTSRALGRLAALAARPHLSGDEWHERGALLEELGRPDEALAAYQSAHAMGEGHARAALAAGDLLLERGDASGARLLERALELDPALESDACERLADHHEAEGRPIEAERFRARARRLATQDSIRQDERSNVSALDLLEPHGLGEDALRPLIAALRDDARVLRAYLTRKRLRHSSGSLYVLGLIAKERPAVSADGLLPAESCLVLLDRSERALQQALEAVPGAQIYAR